MNTWLLLEHGEELRPRLYRQVRQLPALITTLSPALRWISRVVRNR